MVVFRIVSILLGYLFGLFPTGVLYGKAHNVDIRSKGSGNSGMTNSLRVLGWKAGVVVFFGDCLKAVAAMAIIWGVARTRYPDAVKLLELYAGFGAVLGHNFPFYMKFKGGKGIASSVGIVFAFDWRMVPICAILFYIRSSDGIYVFGFPGNPEWIFCTDYRVWTVGIIKDSNTVFAGDLCACGDFDGTGILATPCKYQTSGNRNGEQISPGKKGKLILT